MSDQKELYEEIAEGVTKVISDALAKSGGGFLQGFIGAAAYMVEDGTSRSVFYVMENQGSFLSMGLRDAIDMVVTAQAADMLFGDDEDNED